MFPRLAGSMSSRMESPNIRPTTANTAVNSGLLALKCFAYSGSSWLLASTAVLPLGFGLGEVRPSGGTLTLQSIPSEGSAFGGRH